VKAYDPAKPMIFVHVPKTAGTSVQHVFRLWFGNHLYLHYFDQKAGKMPPRRDLASLAGPGEPIVIFGHFNRYDGFGIEDYYPSVDQFVTVLREPLDAALSLYFFIQRVGGNFKEPPSAYGISLNQYLEQTSLNMLNHFPRLVTHDNYEQIIDSYFIEIGITEMLEKSMKRIAGKLGLQFEPSQVPRLNVTPRTKTFSTASKERFIENHQLEYAVYRCAHDRYMD
jgi:hypothetical protein